MAPNVEEVRRFSARHLAFISPLVLIHLACGLVFVVGASRVAIIVFVLTGAAQLFGLTMCYHRLLSHRSFKTSRWFQFLLAVMGTLAGQNGPLWWVAHHIHHHRYGGSGRRRPLAARGDLLESHGVALLHASSPSATSW